ATLIGGVPATAGLLAATAIPRFQQARTVASGNACINNLRILEAAKDQWAIEENKSTGAVVTNEDISTYLKYKPVCPEGGAYTLGPIGTDTVCSVHGSLR